MYDERTNLARQVVEDIRRHFGDEVYRTVIPRNVRLGEAPSFGKPVLAYDIKSKGAEAYLALGREFLKRRKGTDLTQQAGPGPWTLGAPAGHGTRFPGERSRGRSRSTGSCPPVSSRAGTFRPRALAELADSIREQGIVQPIVVSPRGEKLEIVAGESAAGAPPRWRASSGCPSWSAGGTRTRSSSEIALVENLQRED